MARIERAETAIETLTRTVQALVGPERATTPKPEEPKEPEAEAEDNPELLPTFASEAPTSSETPPRCATPDPLDMLSPEQAMLASLLNVGALGSGTIVVAPQPAPPPLLQPPPLRSDLERAMNEGFNNLANVMAEGFSNLPSAKDA